MSLAEIQARNSKPRERTYKLADGEGLFLLVQPNGSKLWRRSTCPSMSSSFPNSVKTWARTVVLSMLQWALSAMTLVGVSATDSQSPASLHRQKR